LLMLAIWLYHKTLTTSPGRPGEPGGPGGPGVPCVVRRWVWME